MVYKGSRTRGALAAFFAAVFVLCALFSAAFWFRSVRAEGGATLLSDCGAGTTVLDNNPFDGSVEGMPDSHLANMPSGCIGGGGAYADSRAYMVTAESGVPAIPAGSSDNQVIYMEMLNSHQEVARISFTQTVKASQVGSLFIKLYASLDDNTTGEGKIPGGRYLMADRFDMQSHYWYELGLRYDQQLQWITIEISGSDVMRLADEEGNIGALYLYYDTYSPAEKPSRNGHIFIDEISYTLAADEGGDTRLTTFSPRTAALDSDPKTGDPNIPNGLTNMPAGCMGGGGGFGARASDSPVLPDGSSDGFGYSFEILDSHQSLAHISFFGYKGGVSTPYAVSAAQMGTLTLKMYIDVESDGTAGVPVNGKYYLLADRYDLQNQYWYEFSFTRDQQRQWIEIAISGSDIVRLADEEGNIGGLYFYYDTYTHADKPTGGKIFLDEISYTPAEAGAHEGGDPYLTTMSMYTSVLDTDPKNNDEYLLVNGFKNMPAGFLYGAGGGFGTRATNMAALPEGSADGEGIAFTILPDGGQEIAHIAFTRYADGAIAPYSVAAADLFGITVRMYVDVETDRTQGVPVNGKYYLLADRYDMENQDWYELSFTRDQQGHWIYVHITGSDLLRLADEEGNIGGLYFYYDTYIPAEKPTGGTIYLDEIRFDDYTVQKTGGDAAESQTVLYGQTVSVLTAPAKTGYTFVGWQTEAGDALTGSEVFGVDMTGDVILAATYTVNQYTITFEAEGGTISPITQDYGTAVTAPQAPAKEGYTFAGWYEEGEEEAFDFTSMPARNVTLVATYTVNQYTITFEAEGGTVSPITQDYGTAVTAPQAPAKEGYTFAGWYEEGAEEAFDFASMPARDVTLVARYTINEYSVTIKADGYQDIALQKEHGEKIAESDLNSHIPEGYTFGGLFTDAACTEPFDMDTAVTDDLVLYVLWKGTQTPGEEGPGGEKPGDEEPGEKPGETERGGCAGSAVAGVSAAGLAAVIAAAAMFGKKRKN